MTDDNVEIPPAGNGRAARETSGTGRTSRPTSDTGKGRASSPSVRAARVSSAEADAAGAADTASPPDLDAKGPAATDGERPDAAATATIGDAQQHDVAAAPTNGDADGAGNADGAGDGERPATADGDGDGDQLATALTKSNAKRHHPATADTNGDAQQHQPATAVTNGDGERQDPATAPTNGDAERRDPAAALHADAQSHGERAACEPGTDAHRPSADVDADAEPRPAVAESPPRTPTRPPADGAPATRPDAGIGPEPIVADVAPAPEAEPAADVDQTAGGGRRPRRAVRRHAHRIAMRPRRLLVRVHRWLGIALIGWLAVVALTGAWLVVNDATESRLHHDRYRATDGDVGADAVVASARTVLPAEATIYGVTLPRNGRGVYQVGAEILDEPAATDAEAPASGDDPAATDGAADDLPAGGGPSDAPTDDPPGDATGDEEAESTTAADASTTDATATDANTADDAPAEEAATEEEAAATDAEPPATYLRVYVDPGSGAVNGVADEEAGFTWWLYRGHMQLWQDHGIFGVFDADSGWCHPGASGAEPGGVKGVICDVIPDGTDMVAWLAVGWMVVLLSGFYLLYWPGVRRWATAFVVRRGRGRFAYHLSLHKVVGVVVGVPLLVITFTGAAFALPNMSKWYENVTPAKRDFDLWIPPEDAVSGAADGRSPIGLDRALQLIAERYPDRDVQFITPPDGETGTYSSWVTRGFDPWTREGGAGNTYLVLDQYTGDTLYDGTPEEGNSFDQAWDDWSFPVHSGDFGGTATRLLWLPLALSPLLLAVTGLVMNRVRHGKRAKAERRRTAAAAAEPDDDVVIELDDADDERLVVVAAASADASGRAPSEQAASERAPSGRPDKSVVD